MSEHGLNARQERFAHEYLKDLNATQAAIRAGYSARSAYSQGEALLRKPEIAALVDTLKDERAARVQVDADYVLSRLAEIVERCMQEVKPAFGRDGKQLFDDDGNALYRFDAANANRALELIGRHVNVAAWEPIKIEGQVSLVDRLMQARHQVASAVDVEFEELPAPKRTLPASRNLRKDKQ